MRNCLVVLKNKKLCLDMAEYTPCARAFASAGLYFDKISVVAYDSSRDITAQLKDCRSNFDNAVIMCPGSMQNTVTEYLQPLYGGTFSDGIMDTGENIVFLYFTDSGDPSDFDKFAAHINDKQQLKFARSYIKAMGAPRDKLIKVVEDAKAADPSLEVNVFESYGDFTIELVYPESRAKAISGVVRMFATALEEHIYAYEKVDIAKHLYDLLKLRKYKLACAESFTGGGVGKRIVDIPGASEIFYEGLNTYSNDSKCDRLAVKDVTLKTEGAVSAETAKQMANGLMWRGRCNVAVSTTGIAGPQSDNTLKPVGLCYIGIALKDSSSFKGATVYKYNLSGDRKTITETAINYALFLAYKNAKDNLG